MAPAFGRTHGAHTPRLDFKNGMTMAFIDNSIQAGLDYEELRSCSSEPLEVS